MRSKIIHLQDEPLARQTDVGQTSHRFALVSFILHPSSFILLYALLAILLSWPLPLHFNTQLPGSPTWAFDESTFVWNLWYFRHALLDLHTNPLHTNLIFYPLGIDLILYTYNLYNALVALPLEMVLGLPATSNVLFLLSTVLSGYGTFLLVNHLLGGALRGQTALCRMAAAVAVMLFVF